MSDGQTDLWRDSRTYQKLEARREARRLADKAKPPPACRHPKKVRRDGYGIGVWWCNRCGAIKLLDDPWRRPSDE